MILSSPDPACDPYLTRALLAVQHAAFEVEAAFVGSREIPPLREDVVALAAFRGRWVLAWDGVDLLGAAAWHELPEQVEIDRVMVHPAAHRRGVASALLARVVDAAGRRDLVVTTGRDNPPGIAMYAKHGFVAEQDLQVRPGLWLTRMRLSPARA
jgi:GNAT superfamily N-acetyltransferase